MKKQTTIKIMVFAFMVAQLVCGTSQAATNSWNAGSGTWDTSTTSWFSPTTWTDGDSAIFTNRYDAVTVTVSGARTADLVRVGSYVSSNVAYYTLLGGAGVSVKATKFVSQFVNEGDTKITTLTNLAMTLSGKLASGRGWLVLAGTTAVTADRYVTSDDGEFNGFDGAPFNRGHWGAIRLKDTATLTLTNGIVETGPSLIDLSGGTLYTSYLKIGDSSYGVWPGCLLNGVRIVVLPGAQNNDFFQGTSAGIGGPYVSTAGVMFDSGTNNVTVKLPFRHYASGATTDGGLVKLGTGTLTFSGVTNTYNGMTIVSNGTLVVSNMSALSAGHVTVVNSATVSVNSARSGGAISDTNNLYINGSGTVSIESGVNEAVYEFFIDGVVQNPGVWGRMGGGAANQSARISGDGTLMVNHNPTPFVWNVGSGAWDTVTTNWLSGGTPSVWSGSLCDALFTNRSDAVTVTVDSNLTAGFIRVGNGRNDWAKYTLLGGAGKSISATKFVTQFTNDAPVNSTIITNLTMTLSGKLASGRSWLILAGNSAVSADKFVTADDAEFSVAGADPGAWGNLWLKNTATLTVSNGIAVTRPSRVLLDGGTLYAPYLKISDLGSAGNSSILNGGRIVALPSAQNTNYIQFAFGVNLYVSTSGAVFDSDTNTITIRTPLIHDSTGAAIDGGLVKLGTGALAFSGATNTYNGMTIVSNGTLRLAAFDNGVSSNGSVAVASGAFLDLAGFNQTVSNLMGGGSITNLAGGKTLTITGTNTFTGTILGGGTTVVSGVMSPAGPGFIGQMTMNNTLILSGTLQVDVATNGTSASDLLVTQGTLDLTGAKLSVVNTNNLDVDKRYVVLTYSNAPTGAFSDSLLPFHWITQNDTVNKRILLRRESSGSLLMIQ
jgi:autotransporter-associated beta strand protein